MSVRSWLAEAKSIHDLGNFFYLPKGGSEWDEKRDLASEDAWLRRLAMSIPVDEPFRAFYGSRMHDSWVVGVERTSRLVRVKLHSINGDIFARGLADILEIDRASNRWPVDLLLHEPVFMRAARYDPRGALRFADWRDIRYSDPQTGDQFLHDWFFQQEGRIQWIAAIDVRRPKLNTLSPSVYLMVDADRDTAEDRRRDATVEAFGAAAGSLWDDALEKRSSIWHVLGMEGFLIDQMASRGLTRSDFLTNGKTPSA